MTLRTDRMTQLRKEIGMKQYELAEKLGLAPNQVSKYERGESNPTLGSLTIMADLFNTTADYLLGRSDIPHPGAEPDPHPDLTPAEIEMLDLFRAHAGEDQRRLLDLLAILRGFGRGETNPDS